MTEPKPIPNDRDELRKEAVREMTRLAHLMRDKKAMTKTLQGPHEKEITRLQQALDAEVEPLQQEYDSWCETFFQLAIEDRQQLFGRRKSVVIEGALIKQIPSDELEITDEAQVIKRLKEIGRADLIVVKESVNKMEAKKKTNASIFHRIKKGWRRLRKLNFNVDLDQEPRPKSVSLDDPFHPSRSIQIKRWT